MYYAAKSRLLCFIDVKELISMLENEDQQRSSDFFKFLEEHPDLSGYLKCWEENVRMIDPFYFVYHLNEFRTIEVSYSHRLSNFSGFLRLN